MVTVNRERWERLIFLYRKWRKLAPPRQFLFSPSLPLSSPRAYLFGWWPSDIGGLIDVSNNLVFLRSDAEVEFKSTLQKLKWIVTGQVVYPKESISVILKEAVSSLLKEVLYIVNKCGNPDILYLSVIDFFVDIFLDGIGKTDETSYPMLLLGDPFSDILEEVEWAVLVDVMDTTKENCFEWIRGVQKQKLVYTQKVDVHISESKREMVELKLTEFGKKQVADWWKEQEVLQGKGGVFIEEVNIMRDKYEAGQAVAMGPGAHAHDFQQIWNQVGANIDLPTLASELSKLRDTMRQEATLAEQDISCGAVASAELAAREGRGPDAIKSLAKAGKWALKIAEKIGTVVAAEAIKKSLNL